MTEKPVPWKPSDYVTNCDICKKGFSFFTRKRHCRACGDVVCSSCISGKKIAVIGYKTPESVCATCAETFESTVNMPVEKVNALCSDYRKAAASASSGTAALTTAQVMLEAAAKVLPAPFSVIAHASLKVVQLGMNAAVNRAESQRLASRIARINFAIVGISTSANTPFLRQCAANLTSVFNEAVCLLEQFQSGDTRGGFIDRVKAKWQQYSAGTASKFNDIHTELTTIIMDRSLALGGDDRSALADAPSIEEITSCVRNELIHVVSEVQKIGSETGEKLDDIQKQLQHILQSPAFTKLGVVVERVKYDPRDVTIDRSHIFGRGAFGVVYAGLLFGMTEVAVKMISNASVDEVEKEITRTMRVSHVNVVKIYGIVAPSAKDGFECPAVVMERLGKPLNEVLSTATHTSLPFTHRMKYTNDIIAGMARVHSLDDGVVHFDLKPANILLTQNGRVAKIIDFGVSQTRTTVQMEGRQGAVGTYPFMAPEHFSGVSRTSACDVYSFAVLMYELWSGRTAWEGFTDAAIVASVKEGGRPASHTEMITAGIPDPIIAVIRALWAQDPHDRPTFAQCLALRSVDNFWEAPQKVWPSFLQDFQLVDQSSAGSPNTPFNVMPTLPPLATFMKLTSDQLSTVLSGQEITDDICQWLKDKRINGEAFATSNEKILAKLRGDAALEEFHVDAVERIMKKLQKEQAAQEKAEQHREAAKSQREKEHREAEAKRQQEEEARRQKLQKEEADRIRADEARREQEQRQRQQELYNQHVRLNLAMIDIWVASVNSHYDENALRRYMSALTADWTATVHYRSAGAWKTVYGRPDGLPPHYRNELWKTGVRVVEKNITQSTPTNVKFTYVTVTSGSAHRTNIEAEMKFGSPGYASSFDVRIL